MEKKKILINCPEDTLAKIDAYAEKMTINRTAAILVLCNQALDSQRAMNDISELLKLAKNEII